MKKLLCIALLIVSGLAACKKDPPTPTQQAQNLLIGVWNYTKKGESFPAGSQQVFTNFSGETDEFTSAKEWIKIINGSSVTYHWQLTDPNTLKKVETDENYKIIELTDTKFTFSISSFKNGVQGDNYYYYTK